MDYSEQYKSHITEMSNAFSNIMEMISNCKLFDPKDKSWEFSIPYEYSRRIDPSELIDIVDNSVNDLSEGLESILEDKYSDICENNIKLINDLMQNHFIQCKKFDIEDWEIEDYILDHLLFSYPYKEHMDDEVCVALCRNSGQISASCLTLNELNEAMHIDGKFSEHISRMMESFK